MWRPALPEGGHPLNKAPLTRALHTTDLVANDLDKFRCGLSELTKMILFEMCSKNHLGYILLLYTYFL